MIRFRSGCRVIRVEPCNGGVVGHPSPGAGGWHFVVKYSEHKLNIQCHLCHLTPARKVPHPNLGSDVNPAEIYESVRKHAPSNMEGVFIAGNGFRAIGVIAALEEDLGRPVLTGNQVAFWYALRLAGVGAEVDNYGQVFKKKPNRK